MIKIAHTYGLPALLAVLIGLSNIRYHKRSDINKPVELQVKQQKTTNGSLYSLMNENK